LLIIAAFAGPAVARDVNPPPWDPTLPNQTTQTWESTVGPGPGPATSHNPYGTTYAQWQQADYWDGLTHPLATGPEGTPIPTWHVNEVGGGVMLYIPNSPDPNAEKRIFWQITSDKAPNNPTSSPPGTTAPDPYGPAGFPGSNWYTNNGLLIIQPNPAAEYVWFTFPADTNISEIVVDTVCTPEPATMLLLTTGGAAVLAVRRRRKNDSLALS
jgi:hypothetical protein